LRRQARASQVIDPVAARHTAVHTDGKVLLTLTNGPATPEVVIILRHKKNPGARLPHARTPLGLPLWCILALHRLSSRGGTHGLTMGQG
jgi:hypothetical protein